MRLAVELPVCGRRYASSFFVDHVYLRVGRPPKFRALGRFFSSRTSCSSMPRPIILKLPCSTWSVSAHRGS